MGTLASRSGRVVVRVGGNSQEAASVQDNLPNNTAIFKTDKAGNLCLQIYTL
jgi:hypothetical protein